MKYILLIISLFLITLNGNVFARTALTSDTTYYISPTGNDSLDGKTPATAWATAQHAWDWSQQNLDLRGQQLYFQLLPSAYPYTASITASGKMVGQGSKYPQFMGDLINPWNVLFHTSSHCFSGGLGAVFGISGVTVWSDTGNGIFSQWPGTIIILGNNIYYNCGLYHMEATKNGWIFQNGNYTIWGAAQSHAAAIAGAIFISGGDAGTCTIYGTPLFTNAFVYAASGGWLFSHTMTFNGPVYGKRYSGIWMSIVASGGNGENYFPGSLSGTVDSTSLYE